MNYKIGCDVTKVSRFENKIYDQNFIDKVLNKDEIISYNNLQTDEKIIFLAKKWSTLESLSKIDGEGILNYMKYSKVTLVTPKKKKPFLINFDADISFSHEDDYLFTTIVKGEKC